MKIVARHAVDDFQSLLIANAMESVGVSVFSVCKNRQDIQTRRFIVWGKYDGDDSILEIMDKAISKELYDPLRRTERITKQPGEKYGTIERTAEIGR